MKIDCFIKDFCYFLLDFIKNNKNFYKFLMDFYSMKVSISSLIEYPNKIVLSSSD